MYGLSTLCNLSIYLSSSGFGCDGGKAVWDALQEEVGRTMRLGHVFLIGDLNARTSALPDFPGTITQPMHDTFNLSDALPTHSLRHSRDKADAVNRWGTNLLDICKSTSMRIANGRVPGDEEGEVTFVSSGQEGSSLIDYVLAGPSAMPLIQSLHVLPTPESDHSALQLILQRQAVEPSQRRHRKRRGAQQQQQQPAAPAPKGLTSSAELEAWQQLLQQPSVCGELMMLEVAASVASCAEDVHAVGEGFDKLIERTQAEVLDAKPSLQRRRRQQQTFRRKEGRKLTRQDGAYRLMQGL